MPIKESHCFDPIFMAQQELAVFQAAYDGLPRKVFVHASQLLQTQFALTESDAVTARSLNTVYTDWRRRIGFLDDKRDQDRLTSSMVALLLQYHSILSFRSELQYNVDNAVRTELQFYDYLLHRNVPALVNATVAYFSTIYGLPEEIIEMSAKKRERAFTILLTLHELAPTQTTWNAVYESFLAYYTSLAHTLQVQVTQSRYYESL